ncbi:MAG: hypothetical protein ABIO84_02960 [Lysobacter sp.]
MNHDLPHCASNAVDNNDHLVARLYELTRVAAPDSAELETLDAIVYQRLLETYGDDSSVSPLA